jgi:3-oxoacyl-[acyl-carrier protein] reductase
MTLSAARECLRFGATANTILPRARTRMTLTGPWAGIFEKPEEGFDQFAPEHVSPLVGWLASPLAERVSGQVFVIWGKHITVVTRPGTDTRFETDEVWDVDGVQAQLGPHFEKLEPVTDGFIVPST